MSKIFLDTNILCYPLDKTEKKKGNVCRSLLEKVRANHKGVISTQVLQEFYVVATRKLHVEPMMAKGLVTAYEHFETVTVTGALIREAIDCQVISKIPFWDALIVVAAESARCESIWSEDFNHGQIIRGVKIENPFAHD
jgi:predicted nucleic acid-binding protein